MDERMDEKSNEKSDGDAMQANVAAPCGWAEDRYEVDYRGECEGNLMSGFWW